MMPRAQPASWVWLMDCAVMMHKHSTVNNDIGLVLQIRSDRLLPLAQLKERVIIVTVVMHHALYKIKP